MQRHRQVIVLYKVTPMTVRLSATGIELPVPDLLPGLDDLLRYGCDILGCDHDLYLPVFLLFIRLHKIEFRTDHTPVPLFIAIHQDLVENGLTPVIPAVRLPGIWRRQLLPGP